MQSQQTFYTFVYALYHDLSGIHTLQGIKTNKLCSAYRVDVLCNVKIIEMSGLYIIHQTLHLFSLEAEPNFIISVSVF